MVMLKTTIAAASVCCVATIPCALAQDSRPAVAQDMRGAQHHAALGPRPDGFAIVVQKSFRSARNTVHLGPYGNAATTRAATGPVSYTLYQGGRTTIAAHDAFVAPLTDQGFQQLYACVNAACGQAGTLDREMRRITPQMPANASNQIYGVYLLDDGTQSRIVELYTTGPNPGGNGGPVSVRADVLVASTGALDLPQNPSTGLASAGARAVTARATPSPTPSPIIPRPTPTPSPAPLAAAAVSRPAPTPTPQRFSQPLEARVLTPTGGGASRPSSTSTTRSAPFIAPTPTPTASPTPTPVQTAAPIDPLVTVQPAGYGGTGPEPEWVKLPIIADMFLVYPPEALTDGVGGQALLRCFVRPDGWLDCTTELERPQDRGFGDAALGISRQARLAGELPSGESSVGVEVGLAVEFRPTPRTPLPDLPLLFPPRFVEPNSADPTAGDPNIASANDDASDGASGPLPLVASDIPSDAGQAANQPASQPGSQLTSSSPNTSTPDNAPAQPGEVVWRVGLTFDDLQAAYPERARAQFIEETVELNCVIAVSGRLACELGENGRDRWGFHNAALQLAAKMRAANQLSNGTQSAGYEFPLTFDFVLRE